MKTLTPNNKVIKNFPISEYPEIIELEGDETPDMFPKHRDALFVRFLEYTANCTPEMLEKSCFYSKAPSGMAFETIQKPW